MRRYYSLILLSLMLCTTSVQAQQNNYDDSRNFLGVQAGHLSGPFTRFFFHPNFCLDIAAGYLARAEAIGGNFSLLANIPVGLFRKNAIYFGGGYIGSRDINLVSVAGKIGYRAQLGYSPFFLHAEWSPWFYEDWEFDPLGGGIGIAYAFKRRKDRRRNTDDPMNGYYTWALGIKVGTHLGLTSRIFTSPRTAIHFDLQYEVLNDIYDFTFRFTYNQPIGGLGLFAYAGVGGGFSPYRSRVPEEGWLVASHLGGVVGLEYNIFAIPIHLGIQLEPSWSDEFGFTPYQGAALIRYTFGSN